MAAVTGDLYLRARFSLPKAPGGRVTLVDRSDETGEDRVMDWGEMVLLLSGDADTAQMTISNLPLAVTPVGNGRFSDYWSLNRPPDGSAVTIEYRTSSTASWSEAFVGAISEVSQITEREVVLHIGGTDERQYRDIGDIITRTEYPQAAESAVDAIKPIVLGEVTAFPPPHVRERKRAILKESILAGTAITSGAPLVVTVNDNTGWPTTGTLKINDEVFGFDQSTLLPDNDDEIRLVSRAQSGTTAQTHSANDQMSEQALAKWLVAGHACNAVSAVYGVSGDGNLTVIDPTNYTLDLGGVTGETTVELVDPAGLTVTAPSENAVYRRVEMDTDALKGGGAVAASHIPPGYPASDGEAKNAALAAGDAGSWNENTYAIMRKDGAATLALYRSAPALIPPIQPDRVYLAIEHYGLEQFAIVGELKLELGDNPLTDILVHFDNKLSEDLGFGSVIAVDDEWMAIGGSGFAGVTLLGGGLGRGALGTTVSTHGVGALIRLVRNPPGVGDGRVEMPQVHVFLETNAHLQTGHTYQEVGKLRVGSDVPQDVVEQEGYTEGTSLSAWHGHVVAGLPVYGKTANDANVGYYGDKFQFPQFLGDLVVGTVKNKSQVTGNKVLQQLLPLSPSSGGFVTPGAAGWLVHLGPVQSALAASMNQRVVEMRIRVTVSSSNGSSNPVRTEVWVSSSPNNGVSVKVFDKTENTGQVVNYSTPAESVSYKVLFNENSGFPDGIRVSQLMAKDFAVRISAPDGGVRLHHAAIDFRFSKDQLTGGSTNDEFLNDRSIHVVSPALIMADNQSTYSNLGDPGPDGEGLGDNGYTDLKFVNVLGTGGTTAAFTKDPGVAFLALDAYGKKDAVVRFTRNPTSVRDVARISMHFPTYITHARARIFRLSLLMRVAARTTSKAPTVRLIKSGVGAFSPFNSSAGGGDNYDNDNDGIGGRLWRWTWRFTDDDDNFLVKDLHNFYIQVEATGFHEDQEEWYAAQAMIHLETNDPRANIAQTIKAEQFTRVNYFDVTEHVTAPADVENLGVVMSIATDLYDTDLIAAFGNQKCISKDYKNLPIFVHRVWWVFEQRGSDETEVTRIAVDVDGYALTPGFEGARAIQRVLTSGPPLLSYPAATSINNGSFISATSAGMHKLRGVIQQRIGARELINKLCEQARVWGFWEAGQFRVLYKFDPDKLAASGPRAVFDYDLGHILDDSVELSPRPKKSVTTRVTVNARPDYAKGGYKIDAAVYAPIAEAELGTRLGPLKIDADFLWTQEQADSLAEQELNYRRLPEVILRFQTSLYQVARDLRRGDLLGIINHALIDAADTFQVVGINRSFGTLASGIPVYEIEAVQRILTFEAEYLLKSSGP